MIIPVRCTCGTVLADKWDLYYHSSRGKNKLNMDQMNQQPYIDLQNPQNLLGHIR